MNGIAAMGIASGLFVGLALMVAVIAMALNMAGENLKDANLKLTRVLPNGAATTTSLTGIDTGHTTTLGQAPRNVELLATIPALTTTELGDAQVITMNIKHSDNADLSASAQLFAAVCVSTGAGGAGDVVHTKRFRLPSDTKRYVFFETVKSGASNASTSSATLEVLA